MFKDGYSYFWTQAVDIQQFMGMSNKDCFNSVIKLELSNETHHPRVRSDQLVPLRISGSKMRWEL